MDYWQVMKLPIRIFWLMNFNVSKILAEKDLRHLTLLGSQTTEGMGKLRRHFIVEMEGEKVSSNRNNERDQEGVEQLKVLAALM
jgi:hypothetical protein